MFEKAGPRERIYFDPQKSKAAIVTCGGLCPGLNNVIRHLYFALRDGYGVPAVYGVRNGYLGLTPEAPQPPEELTADWVEAIHHRGGTMLGTLRRATGVGVGTWLGFIFGTVVKIGLCFAMLGIFVFALLVD